MLINAVLAEVLFYVALILLSPIFFKLSRLATRYLLNRYVADAEIVVTTKRGGVVVSVQRIKTTGYVVDQLKAVRGDY